MNVARSSYYNNDPPSPSARSFSSDLGHNAPSGHVSFNPEAETSSFHPEGPDDSRAGSPTAVSGKRLAFIEYWVRPLPLCLSLSVSVSVSVSASASVSVSVGPRAGAAT